MNLKQVKSLLAVVDTGSVNRAADELCLAPSSVSAQLRELSASLGISLFEPAGRGLILSNAGRQLLPKFRQLMQLSDELVCQAHALVSEPTGELRLYAPSSMCIYRLPPLIESLQSLAPAVELHLQHDPFDYKEALQQRSIEAAVIVTNSAEAGFAEAQIASEEVIYVAHPSLVVPHALTPERLRERALITTEPGCSYRVAAENHFKQCSLQLTPRQCFSNVEVIRRCLLARMGIGLLPRCVVNADIEQGHLAEQAVDGAPYLFRSTLIWPEEAAPSARLLAFIEAVNATAITRAQTGKDKQTRISVKRQVAVQE